MKFRINFRHILLPAIAMFFVAGCYNDKADQLYPEPGTGGTTCDTANISFNTAIKPIMTQYCAMAGCHDAATPSFGYDLSIYDGVKLANTNGRLLGAINHLTGFQPMPKGMGKMSECNINKITAWINQGTLNN